MGEYKDYKKSVEPFYSMQVLKEGFFLLDKTVKI